VNRRPPRLEDSDPLIPREPADEPPVREAREGRERRAPDPAKQVLSARLAGRHERIGVAEFRSVLRRVAMGHRDALLGLDRFDALTEGSLEAVARAVWGWRAEASESWTDPDHTVDGMRRAAARIVDVARRGGRIAFATSRPASLLPLHSHLVRIAITAGADIAIGTQSGEFSAAGHARCRLWWPDGVAVITDGDSIVADVGLRAAHELLFAVEMPDLVVADRGFAAGAVRAGIETVAFADLDAVALGAEASRGLPVTVVPVQDRRPPAAYRVLAALANEASAAST
jgi:hypothetical protein